jgi:hypothetical protein
MVALLVGLDPGNLTQGASEILIFLFGTFFAAMGQSVSKHSPKSKAKKAKGTKKKKNFDDSANTNVRFTYTTSVCKYKNNEQKFNCTRKVVSKGLNNNNNTSPDFNTLLSNFFTSNRKSGERKK